MYFDQHLPVSPVCILSTLADSNLWFNSDCHVVFSSESQLLRSFWWQFDFLVLFPLFLLHFKLLNSTYFCKRTKSVLIGGGEREHQESTGQLVKSIKNLSALSSGIQDKCTKFNSFLKVLYKENQTWKDCVEDSIHCEFFSCSFTVLISVKISITFLFGRIRKREWEIS